MLPALADSLVRLGLETLPLLIAVLSGHRLFRSTGPNRALYLGVTLAGLGSGLALAGAPSLVPRSVAEVSGLLCLPLWLLVRHLTRASAGAYRAPAFEPVFRTSRRPLLLTHRLRGRARAG